METHHLHTDMIWTADKEEETEEPLEKCKGTEDLRYKVDMEKDHNRMVFWRKLTKRLRDIIKHEEHAENMNKKQRVVADPSDSRQYHRAM